MPIDPLLRAREVLHIEAEAVARLKDRVSDSFAGAVSMILECRGHLIVTGMGKAGKIAEKISATFASTGTPSLFLHPAEAVHGDLGRCLGSDVILALSNSGSTDEIVRLIPAVKQIGARLIALTGDPGSPLGRAADVVLNLGPVPEACPLGLAPTASTIAMLAMGDALAMVVLESRGFTRDDFALFHPAGSLGLKLLKVRDRMRTGDLLPLVQSGASVADCLQIMGARTRAGAALVTDLDGRLLGIFTDGDLRRSLQNAGGSIVLRPVNDFMIKNPRTIGPDALAAEGRRLLHEYQIDQVPVVDANGIVAGLLDVQDLLGIPLE